MEKIKEYAILYDDLVQAEEAYKEYCFISSLLQELPDATVTNGLGETVSPEEAEEICREACETGRLAGTVGEKIIVTSLNPHKSLTIVWNTPDDDGHDDGHYQIP